MAARSISRFFSTISPNFSKFSEEEIQAINVLKQKSRTVLSRAAQNVMKKREWARAPVVEVSGKMPGILRVTKKGQKFVDPDDVDQPMVLIRWIEQPERDLDIALNEDETLYSVEVKAVLYGIIQAISYNEANIRMKNANQVVVRVANGKYSASKEAARFQLIRKVVDGKDPNKSAGQLKAALEHNEKGIRRISKNLLTEAEFFKRNRKSIDDLKNYL